LIDNMAADQHRHLDDLLNIMLALVDLDPQHLKKLDDGPQALRGRGASSECAAAAR
jgi:hypothetical protein